VRRVPAAVLDMAKHPIESRQRAAAARAVVDERQRAAMQVIAATLAGG
jgi:non-homologous end joining protein Ku